MEPILSQALSQLFAATGQAIASELANQLSDPQKLEQTIASFFGGWLPIPSSYHESQSMKTHKNPFIEAAKQATGFGRFCPYVRRCKGVLERYSNTHYGLITPERWITGTKEQVLEEVHNLIINYNNEN